MQSVNAQEKPWKSSEEFDIKIKSDSAQCTLQVPIPTPGTREKGTGKRNPTPQPILDPPFCHVFRLIPKSLWCFLLPACQTHQVPPSWDQLLLQKAVPTEWKSRGM